MMLQIADGSITSNSRSLWDVTTELVPAIKMLKTPPFPQGRVALLRIRERSGSFVASSRGLRGAAWLGPLLCVAGCWGQGCWPQGALGHLCFHARGRSAGTGSAPPLSGLLLVRVSARVRAGLAARAALPHFLSSLLLALPVAARFAILGNLGSREVWVIRK